MMWTALIANAGIGCLWAAIALLNIHADRYDVA